MTDNFSSPANWITNLRYNVSLGIWSNSYVIQGGDSTPQLFQYWLNNNRLTMNGGYVGAPVGYSSSFYGIYSLFTNSNYTATKEMPFGYEVTRNNLLLDDGTEAWQAGVFDIGVVQAKRAVTNGNSTDGMQGAKFDNTAILTELDWQNKSTRSYLNWRQASFTNSKIPLTAVTNNAGGVDDLSALLEWQHSAGANNNPVTYRVVNDSEYVYIYVNPSPNGINASYSNAYYLVDKMPVVFSSNLQAFFGLGAINYNGFSVCVSYSSAQNLLNLSNFMIRSVCSNLTSELSPGEIKSGATIPLYLTIRPIFSSNMEAGVGELLVELPDSYTNLTNWSAYTNDLSVSWINTNGTQNKYFTNQFGDVNPAPLNVRLSLKDGGKTLKIRFCSSNSVTASDVFHPLKWGGGSGANSNAILLVVTNFRTSTNADSVGKTLTVYANNEKYFDTSWSNVATTGRMRSYAGDAMDISKVTNSLRNYNSLSFKTYNSPHGYSSISPNKVYEGVSTVFQYEVAAANPNNNADITKAVITVPMGFGIDTNVLYSDKMMVSNHNVYLYLTNILGTNQVIADYGAKGIYLPANGGWDTIYFLCTNTTNVPDGSSGVTVKWPAQAYSSLTLNYTNTLTNAFYPSQDLTVRKKPPLGTVSVTPTLVSNTLVTNTFNVLIRNTATEDPNRIKLVRIRLPNVFTNLVNATSASNGIVTSTVTNGSIWVTVSYTNVPPDTYIPANGGYDVISLVLEDNIAGLSDITNVIIYADADNLNGDEWIPLTESGGGHWDLTFFTPPANGYAHIDNPGPEASGSEHNIYTDMDVETNLTVILENKGEDGNHISQARFVFPAGITNAQYVGDTKLAQPALSNEYTNVAVGVTNTNVVLYLNYTNTLKSKIGATSAEQDYISLKVWDAIDVPGTAHISVYVRNVKTNLVAATEVPDNTVLTYIYPPVNAKGYVSVSGGFIDWSSVTNLVEYYITNMGRTKNEILQAKITIPTEISTNIPVSMITSTYCTNPAFITYSGGVITVNYGTNSGTKFSGGKQDKISFQMIDIVTNTVTVRLTNFVTNSRTNVILPETAASAQSLFFKTPPVMATFKVEPSVVFVQSSGFVTDQIVLTITNHGSGNNNINQVAITSPFGVSQVLDISNAVMKTKWSVAPALIDMTGNVITLFYKNTNTNLTAGVIDTVTVWLKNDYTNEQDFGWSVTADNDLYDAVPFTNVGVMAGATNRTYIVEKAQVYTDPNVVVTSTESNYFKYSLKNGTVGDPNGRPIYKAKIVVTDPFTNVSGLSMEQSGTVTVSNINASTRWVLVNYPAGLQAGEADNIRFWLQDNWVIGTNYADLPSEVDYSDGGGWRSSAVEASKSTGVSFSFPPASGTGYILSGEWVPEDFTNYTYQFYIKNTGDSGNNLKLLKITPPNTITNITSITCLTKQLGGTFDGTNVFINYEAAGKQLSSLETDTVQLVGYDNVSGGNVYTNWGFKVANTTTNVESYRIDITVPANKSLSNIIYHPNYKTSVYLEAVNSIDGSDSNRNKVWTTKTSNTFNYFIYNQSDTGNNVTKAKIYIPGGTVLFDTNTIQVTNTKGGTITLISNRTIISIVYGSALVPGDFDTVQIKINDKINYGETNLDWTNDVAYDTTDNRFKPSQEYTGKSLKSYFLMPVPAAKSGIVTPVPREVYTKTTNVTVGYAVTNTGDGSNDLFAALITIPDPFRALFDTNSVSNTMATNKYYDSGSGVLSLFYTNNFKVGSNDTVYLKLQGSGLTVSNYSFDCQVSNYTYAASAGDTALNSKVLNIVGVPSFYASPNSLSTTTASNDVNVFILNNTGGQSKLKKVVLSFSSPFTNYTMTNSLMITNLTHIMGMISSVTLDYAADLNEISAGGNDAVTFRLLDSIQVGDTTASVSALGYNGFQWVIMDKDVGGLTNIDFVMPPVDASAKINYTQIYTTVKATNMGLTVYNDNPGGSKISRLKIYVPMGLTNVTFLSNQVYTDAVTTNSNNTIFITYQNTNLFNTSATDVVWFSYSNALTTGTNVTFALDGVNLTNGAIDSRYVSIPGEGGAGSLNLRVDYPAVSVQGYINGRSQLFTINTNDTIEYRIVNGSLNTSLTNARIYYNPNLMKVFSVSNTWTNTTYSTNASYIQILYTNTAIQFSQRDIVRITFGYSITNVTNTMLTSRTVLYGVTNGTFDTVDAGYTQRLDVTVASWGKIKGQVWPTNYNVSAKVYYPGTSVIATNIDGALASTTTVTNGLYSLTMIPNGDYTLELSAPMFRTFTTAITVNSNQENLVSIVTMQNAALSPDSTSNQTALCYQDNKSRIEFPTSSISRDFSIDITLVDLTDPQKGDLAKNERITAPSSTSGMKGFQFDVRNYGNSMMEGEVLKMDATLYLAYDLTDITSRGWSEDALSIYYWDRITSKWVRIGGTVDKVNRVVTAKVSYVHGLYGVFSGKSGDGTIRNVVVRPRIFTPTGKTENGYFANVRITFELDQLQAADGYEVKIYDMRGTLVKSFTRKGSYAQGEVAWDSKDDNGYSVKGGVYIYRVIAGGKSYNGTIVIVR